jgi:hypothetical protein
MVSCRRLSAYVKELDINKCNFVDKYNVELFLSHDMRNINFVDVKEFKVINFKFLYTQGCSGLIAH